MRPEEWLSSRPVDQLPVVTSVEEAHILGLIKYPSYTRRNPNPKTGNPDCALEKRFKDGAREAYIKKLINAIPTEKRIRES